MKQKLFQEFDYYVSLYDYNPGFQPYQALYVDGSIEKEIFQGAGRYLIEYKTAKEEILLLLLIVSFNRQLHSYEEPAYQGFNKYKKPSITSHHYINGQLYRKKKWFEEIEYRKIMLGEECLKNM